MLSPEEQITAELYESRDFASYAASFYATFPDEGIYRFSELLPAGRVLDLGCGCGYDGNSLIISGYRYVGIDRSYMMLSAGKPNHENGVEVIQMEMEQLGFVSGCFDGFLACASLMHIPKSKILGVLQEIRRVVRSGGIGYLYLRMGDFEGIEEDEYGRRALVAAYPAEQFFSLLQQSGFEIIEFAEGIRCMGYFVKVVA